MTEMVTMSIEDISLKITTGNTPKTNELLNFIDAENNWFTPGDFSDSIITLKDSSRKISRYAIDNSAVLFSPKTVLITCIGNIGNSGIIENTASANQQITGVFVDEKIINPYLFNYLIRHNKQILKDKSKRAIVPILNNKDLKSIELSFPKDLEIQQKIVAILDKATALIKKREETINVCENLIRAIFLDMFLKFQGVDTAKLEVVADVVAGLTKGKRNLQRVTQLVPYMRVANVQDGYLDLKEIKKILATENEIQRFLLQRDDLLLTEGGDPDKLGRGTLWKNQVENCIYQNHIFRVRIKDTNYIDPTFLSYQFSSQYGKHFFLKAAKQTSGIASINSKQLKSFPVYRPPIELQKDFSKIVSKIDLLKSKLTIDERQSRQLLNSLSQLAFKGKLTFNTAVDLEILLENDYNFFKRNSTDSTLKLLLDRLDKYELNITKFHEQASYNNAKNIAFELLKDGKIKQVFDEVLKSVKLDLV